MKLQPLIVITGPTASGKSALALDLAQKYNGEIICADSRTVYKGLDIGTAKPSKQEQAKVRHHLLDVIEPSQRFTLKDFQTLAFRAITDIRSRGKIPFLVGGTGLYVDSVVLRFKLADEPVDFEFRQQLEQLTVAELQKMIKKQHKIMPENKQNKRHLIRSLERSAKQVSKLERPDKNTIVVAISTENKLLDKRIVKRAEQIFKQDVIAEAKQTAELHGWDNSAMSGNIYPIIQQLAAGEITQPQAKTMFIKSDQRLVKKQLTWLKRHKFIHWLDTREASKFISQFIEQSK